MAGKGIEIGDTQCALYQIRRGRALCHGSDGFIKFNYISGAAQLSQRASVSVQMHSTDSEQLSTSLEDEQRRNVSLSVEVVAERVTDLIGQSNDHLLRLNYSYVSKENFEIKVSDQEVNSKAVTTV